MKLTIPNNQEDYVNAQFFMMENMLGKIVNNSKIFRILFSFLLGFISLINLRYFYLDSSNYFNLIIGVMCLAFAIFYRKYINYIYRRTFNSYYKYMEDESDTNVDLNSQELHFQVAGIESKMNTADILCFYETKEYFFIQIRKLVVIYLPKRLFENIEDAKAELKSYAASHRIEYKIV